MLHAKCAGARKTVRCASRYAPAELEKERRGEQHPRLSRLLAEARQEDRHTAAHAAPRAGTRTAYTPADVTAHAG